MDAAANITQGSGLSRSLNSQNQLTQVGTGSLTYDNNGNTLTDQAGNTYTFDAWNHIVSLNGTYTFKWDALGRKIVEGTTGLDLYYNTSGNVVEERSSGTGSTAAQYIWGMGYVNDLVAKDNFTNGVRVYAEQDANWNVTSLTDTNGNPVERFMYDPYGTRTVLSPSWTVTSDWDGMPYGFQGGRADRVSGLMEFGARTYNPATDTWTRQDPAGAAASGPNLYQTDASNPESAVDPTVLVVTDISTEEGNVAATPEMLAQLAALDMPTVSESAYSAFSNAVGAYISSHPFHYKSVLFHYTTSQIYSYTTHETRGREQVAEFPDATLATSPGCSKYPKIHYHYIDTEGVYKRAVFDYTDRVFFVGRTDVGAVVGNLTVNLASTVLSFFPHPLLSIPATVAGLWPGFDTDAWVPITGLSFRTVRFHLEDIPNTPSSHRSYYIDRVEWIPVDQSGMSVSQYDQTIEHDIHNLFGVTPSNEHAVEQ